MNAREWIKALNLQPHPEGGYYRETYKGGTINGRACANGIYYLLEAGDVSRFHRIDADEMWHFYGGDSLNVHVLDPVSGHNIIRLGSDPSQDQVFQAVVPKGVWFGADVAEGGDFALVGCTVSPGFEFSGFELADRDAIMRKYPTHADIIKHLT